MTTFKEYINLINTENTLLYKKHLSIDDLPDKICSSKIIHKIIKNDLQNSYYASQIFRNTFMEYFKWKLIPDEM